MDGRPEEMPLPGKLKDGLLLGAGPLLPRDLLGNGGGGRVESGFLCSRCKR